MISYLPWLIVLLLIIGLVGLFILYRQEKASRIISQQNLAHLSSELQERITEFAINQAFYQAQDNVGKDAIIALNDERHILRANEAAQTIFGPLRADASLISWTQYHHLSEIVDQTLTLPGHVSQQLEYEGKIYLVRATTVKSYDEVLGWLIFLRDVSELQRLGRARRDLVANISHDLRTPITSIRLIAETLLSGAIDKPAVAQDLSQKVLVETESLEQINQELMDLSMIESGRFLIKLLPVNVTKRAKKEIKRLKPQAERKDIDLIIDMPSKVKVLADKALLTRVFSNLLHNAIKFTSAGSVTISADYQPANDMVTISVADTGAGISPEKLERIFERFYTGDDARKRDDDISLEVRRTGTGLGLAIVKHIIEAHGGEIWVKSRLGEGTTFYFTLPPEDILRTDDPDDEFDDNGFD